MPKPKNVLVEIINTIIKRWADPAIPFLYALLFEFAFRNLPKALMPNIQLHVGQIKLRTQLIYSSPPLLKKLNHASCWSNKNARAIDLFVPTPSKEAKTWEIIYF